MKTLLINSHPNFNNKEHYSYKLQKQFLRKYKENFSDKDLTVINLYDIEIPRIEMNGLLGIWNKQMAGITLNEHEEIIAKKSKKLLEQFKEHHRIVIVTPFHNFNITSRMKDYMDNILIARETFKYTESGSVGLMTDDYKALLLQSSGSIYTNNDKYTPLEFPYYYLKATFEEMMGFDKFYIVRAQGTALLSEDEILKSSNDQLDSIFDKFYSSKK